MLSSSIYLLLIFLLFTCSWSSIVKDDNGPSSWNKTKYLTRSNWTSSLKPNAAGSKVHHPVWFIFNYLTYCGYCKSVMPGWEAIAQYTTGIYQTNSILKLTFFFIRKKKSIRLVEICSSRCL